MKKLIYILLLLCLACEKEEASEVCEFQYVLENKWVCCEDDKCSYLSFTDDSIYIESVADGDWKSWYYVDNEKIYTDRGSYFVKYSGGESFVLVHYISGEIFLFRLNKNKINFVTL